MDGDSLTEWLGLNTADDRHPNRACTGRQTPLGGSGDHDGRTARPGDGHLNTPWAAAGRPAGRHR